MEEYRFTAFISYRHVSPDADIAKRLHTMIENYHIPANVQKKTGIKKMGRVFRDQEELPLSNDLGGDIYRALDNSQWLIVICSPRYLESKWCNAELNYFLSLGRRDHVLSLLVDGDKAASFPQQLQYEIVDGVRVPLEPLAGDVRSERLKESLKKLEIEKLRMLAPMLDVNFDELRQRAKQRRMRIISAVTAACFVLLAGFLAYTLFKNAQITSQRNIALDNQMQLLIEQSNLSSSQGNKLLAVKQLLEAEEVRKTVGDKNDSQYRAALEYALYSEAFDSILTIDNNNRQFDSLIFSHDDRYLLGITNLNSACLIDASSGRIIHTVSRSDLGQLDSVGFSANDHYFYMVDSWYGFVSMYDVETGQLYRQYDASDGMAWNIGEKVFALSADRMLIVKRCSLVIWNYREDKQEEILPCGNGTFESYTQPLIVQLSPDEQSVATGSHGYGVGMKIMSLYGNRTTDLEHDPERGYREMTFSSDGRFLAAISGNRCCIWNVSSGHLVASINEEEMIDHILINGDGSVALVMSSTYLKAFAIPSGKMMWELTADSNIVTEACLSPDGRYVSAAGGIQGVYDIMTGERLFEGSATEFSHDGRKVICSSYDNMPILSATPNMATARLVKNFREKLFAVNRYTDPSQAISVNLRHNCPEIYSTPPGNANRRAGFYTSEDCHWAAYTHYDGFVEIMDISDPENVGYDYCLAEHCFNAVSDLVFNGELMATCGGFDPRCVLFDLKEGRIRYVLAGQEYGHGAEFSEDGSKIIFVCGYAADKALVYSTLTGNLLYEFTAPEGLMFTDAGFTVDGSKVAAVLSDGSAWVGTVYQSIEEMVREAGER